MSGAARRAWGSDMTAADVIGLLDLQPHPEGGHFRETYRDQTRINAGTRAASTAIYFLLEAGVTSRWHRIDAAEVWHWYAGAALELSISPAGRSHDAPISPAGRSHNPPASQPRGPTAQSLTLGNDLATGERPQAVVPPGHWQQATSCGAWSLVGCTVAPGFEFSTFELAPSGFAPLGP